MPSLTGAYELLVEGFDLRKRGDYGEALLCFRGALAICLCHLNISPYSSLLNVTTARVYIARTLGEMNCQEGMGNAQSRAKIVNYLPQAARMYTNILGSGDDITQQTWDLFDTLPLW